MIKVSEYINNPNPVSYTHLDKSDEAYSPVYLKTLHNQLSAIFNHAVKFYGLKDNPAAKVGNRCV